MKKHCNVHSEDKILECQICSKGYDDQDHLDEHEDSHVNESRYTCMVKLDNNQICGKKYRRKSSIRYLKNAHKKQLDMMYYTKDIKLIMFVVCILYKIMLNTCVTLIYFFII